LHDLHLLLALRSLSSNYHTMHTANKTTDLDSIHRDVWMSMSPAPTASRTQEPRRPTTMTFGVEPGLGSVLRMPEAAAAPIAFSPSLRRSTLPAPQATLEPVALTQVAPLSPVAPSTIAEVRKVKQNRSMPWGAILGGASLVLVVSQMAVPFFSASFEKAVQQPLVQTAAAIVDAPPAPATIEAQPISGKVSLDAIEGQCQRLNSVVQKLTEDLSRIQSGASDVRNENVGLKNQLLDFRTTIESMDRSIGSLDSKISNPAVLESHAQSMNHMTGPAANPLLPPAR
jgi:hypothetical protein